MSKRIIIKFTLIPLHQFRWICQRKESLIKANPYKFFQVIFFVSLIVDPFILTGIKAQPLFEVERESFCREVRGHEPFDNFLKIAEIKKGEGIFLWMEIRAEARAFSMLETKGELPIFHAWASRTGVIEIINVGIKNNVWIKNKEMIKAELKNRGFFTWRTQSFKRNFQEGFYYVSILDANKRPVRKTGVGNGAFRPEILIRFLP